MPDLTSARSWGWWDVSKLKKGPKLKKGSGKSTVGRFYNMLARPTYVQFHNPLNPPYFSSVHCFDLFGQIHQDVHSKSNPVYGVLNELTNHFH
jgi:hypothetical protein